MSSTVSNHEAGHPLGSCLSDASCEMSDANSKSDDTCAHLLLTVLGTKPKPARYSLGGREAEGQVAPVALFDLLPESDRPDRVLAICTPEAEKESGEVLKEGLDGRCQVELIRVSAGCLQEEIDEFMKEVVEAIPPETETITVDITHGFRHFVFLIYSAVLFITTLRPDVRLRGAYYGLLSQDDVSPFLDLHPLLKLPRWLHAISTLTDTGSARPMAEILRDGQVGQLPRRIADALDRFSDAYLSGLPLELGRYASDIRELHLKQLHSMLTRKHRLPLAEELIRKIEEELRPLAIEGVTKFGDGWKGRFPLGEGELEREARLVDNLLDRGHVGMALHLMREWVVSWVICQKGDNDRWLDHDPVRGTANRLLGALKAVRYDKDLRDILTEEQSDLGKFWHCLTELRNGYAHNGMRPQVLIGNKAAEANLDWIRSYWNETLKRLPSIPLALGKSPGRLILVSPIGKSVGVLFSAFKACMKCFGEPSLCLAICSPATVARIREVADQAGYQGEIEEMLLENPHRDVDGIERLKNESRKHLLGAERVVVNVTGGTTLMGLAAEAVAANAFHRLAIPVCRFGLIDRRSPDEQKDDPYQEGETFWIDCSENRISED